MEVFISFSRNWCNRLKNVVFRAYLVLGGVKIVSLDLSRTFQIYIIALRSGVLADQTLDSNRISSLNRKSRTLCTLSYRVLPSIKIKAGTTSPEKCNYSARRLYCYLSHQSKYLFQTPGGVAACAT